MKKLTVEVITPSKSAYKGDAVSITIPGTMGNFQVLYNHAPLMSSFEIGKVKIAESDGTTKLYATSGGTVEVLNNKVLVLAETFEAPEEIDIERAKKAEERARARISDKSNKDIDLDRAEIALKRAINRLKLSK